MVIAGKKMYSNNISTQNTLGLAEDEPKKQRYYNHTKSFQNENNSNCTTLFSLMMICGWTTLTSQHPLENDHKR